MGEFFLVRFRFLFLLAVFLGHFWFAEWCEMLRWLAKGRRHCVKCGGDGVGPIVKMREVALPDVASNNLFST